MRINLVILATIGGIIVLSNQLILAQDKAAKYEIGPQLSTLTFNNNEGILDVGIVTRFKDRTLHGIGGRFSYNLNSDISFETGAIFFIGETHQFAPLGSGGHVIQLLSGIKAGKRFEKVGIFAKGRPGLVSFSKGRFPSTLTLQPNNQGLLVPRLNRATHFAFDAGAVIEFYPKRRLVTRLDIGDTIISYGEQSVPSLGILLARVVPREIRHNLQFSAGVGFRF